MYHASKYRLEFIRHLLDEDDRQLVLLPHNYLTVLK